MPDPQNNPSVTAKTRAPKTWDFMETLFVALVAYAVFSVTGWLAYAMLVAMQGGGTLSPAVLRRSESIATILASGPTIAVLWIAVRMAGRESSEYLDLNWPRRNELIEALVFVAIFWVLEITVISTVEPTDLFGAFGGVGGVFFFFVSMTIAAPIMEEFLCRGFMFRGWSQSFLGPTGAIVLISAIWAAAHVQYNWWEQVWIFLAGLILGCVRWRSRSTWLAVLCHSAMNVMVFFTSGRQV